jgi:hypothetical protein
MTLGFRWEVGRGQVLPIDRQVSVFEHERIQRCSRYKHTRGRPWRMRLSVQIPSPHQLSLECLLWAECFMEFRSELVPSSFMNDSNERKKGDLELRGAHNL